eukprot:5324653-Pyramimonas_sp.AAC.1
MLLESGSTSQFCQGVRAQIPTLTLCSQSPQPSFDTDAEEPGVRSQVPFAGSKSPFCLGVRAQIPTLTSGSQSPPIETDAEPQGVRTQVSSERVPASACGQPRFDE